MPAILPRDNDRDDMGMLECRLGLGLDLESPQLLGIQDGRRGQDLHRHTPPQRDLLSLEDDAHPPAPNLAQEPEIAQGLLDFLEAHRGPLLGRVFESRGRMKSRQRPVQPLPDRTLIPVRGPAEHALGLKFRRKAVVVHRAHRDVRLL